MIAIIVRINICDGAVPIDPQCFLKRMKLKPSMFWRILLITAATFTSHRMTFSVKIVGTRREENCNTVG